MPEGPEIRIMSDFVNSNAKSKTFTTLYDVAKGNNAIDSGVISNFTLDADFNGKELILNMYSDVDVKYSVFMGMSGNWKFVPTENWNETKYVRMRMDTTDGNSLLLYGSYMGPKYRVGGFTGVKRGPDIIKEFEEFENNVLSNLHRAVFDKPICEVLLDQKYFNGIGNYLRSTILYYLDINPFISTREAIETSPVLQMCKDVQLKSYNLNGGQLSDWSNPFDTDYEEFKKWVFYKKGNSCKDATGRTFWYDPKWEEFCPYN